MAAKAPTKTDAMAEIMSAVGVDLATVAICCALAFFLGRYIYRRWGAVRAGIQENFLTIHGLIIALMWTSMITGALAGLIFVNVSVLGNDMSISAGR